MTPPDLNDPTAAPLRALAPRAVSAPPALPGAPRALPPVPAADHLLTPGEAAQAQATAGKAWSGNTQRIYTHHWRAFQAWCAAEGRQALPAAPATVVAYLNARAPAWALASLEQAHGAIGWGHMTAGVDPPPTATLAVKMIMKGLRKMKGRRPKNAKRPVTQDVLLHLLTYVDRSTVRGKRDAALLLVGFNAAMRREELVGIDWEHLSDSPGGVALLIPRSKTDQEGVGYTVGLPYVNEHPDLCPARALWAWREACGFRTGPVFRVVTASGRVGRLASLDPAKPPMAQRLTPATVARVVKHYVRAAGLPAAVYAGHSLRAGFVTEAYRQDVPEAQIMETTRHASATMLKQYRREADPVRRGGAGRLKWRKP